ncbi:baseplate J/gp47 family protein [Piscirickettsia litoralis]|uniref:Baseplate protein J-like domain-containing protein n=1 Tax=Piscirickettsia litoralis TaxID=1891921 RepID=A0ABX2ZX31_9GAMM|nr:baseplate J/gp47 family protein [Piscirickettsia litoralis]ODN41164.1 hypothetical protein BGC07_17985 [Piscirickettsia litoralis]
MSNTLNLAQVPAPDFGVIKTYDEIYQECLDTFYEKLKEQGVTVTLTNSDPAIISIQNASYREYIRRQDIQRAGEQNLIAYANQTNLYNLGAFYGLTPEAGEDDETFRQRVLAAPALLSVAGPIDAYEALTIQAAPLDVQSAYVPTMPPEGQEGTVTVTALKKLTSTVSDADLKNTILTALSKEKVRPNNDQVVVNVVSKETALNYSIKGTIFIPSGPSASTILEPAYAASKLFARNNYRLGGEVTPSAVSGAIYAYIAKQSDSEQSPIIDIELEEPANKIIPTATQAAYCADDQINLTVKNV